MKTLKETSIELLNEMGRIGILDTDAIVNVIMPYGKKIQIQIVAVDSNESEFNDYEGIETMSFDDFKKLEI